MKTPIKITMYTTIRDPCFGRCGSAGYCAVLEYKGRTKEEIRFITGGEKNTTRVAFEIRALTEVLGHLKKPCYIRFVTMSSSLSRTIKFLNYNHKNGYKRKDGEEMKNKEILMSLYEVYKPHTIKVDLVGTLITENKGEQCMMMGNSVATEYLNKEI